MEAVHLIVSSNEKWLDKLLSDIDIDNPQDSKAPELT